MNMLEVKPMCDELLEAKRAGKLTQDQLEYELAKLSLEMLNDYRPRNEPPKPMELVRFEGMSRGEWASMGEFTTREAEARYTNLKAKHKAHCGHILADNNSNLFWLEQCRDIFRKNNNPKWMMFQNVIADHLGIPK